MDQLLSIVNPVSLLYILIFIFSETFVCKFLKEKIIDMIL